MAWTAWKYYDIEKGAAYPLAAPIFAENKQTAERYDTFLAGSGRYYLWDVPADSGSSTPVEAWADIAPETDPRVSAPPPNPGPIFGTPPPEEAFDLGVSAPPRNPGPIFGAPPPEEAFDLGVSAPPPNLPILVRNLVGVEQSLEAGSPRLDPVPIPETYWPPATSPNPPVGPRVIEWVPIEQTPKPPVGYQPIETFPVPEPTVQVPPNNPPIGARPTEWFPTGPVLFAPTIGRDGYTVPSAPIGPVIDLGGVVVDPRQEMKVTVDELLDRLPNPQPPGNPVLAWPDQRAPEQPYGPVVGPVVMEPLPAPPPPNRNASLQSDPNPQPMPTARYSLAGTPEPGEQTQITDTNALLKQALETVGTLANIFVPPTSTAPAPTAAPAATKASPWYEQVPQWAWLIAAAVAGMLLLKKR